jgi:hypothetical protein
MDIESQELIEGRRGHDKVLKWVPVAGLFISFYSAIFATFILYPWHVELSREFTSMSQACMK